MATEVNQQEFRSNGACAVWQNTADDTSWEGWEVCAEVRYESRLFGAAETTTAFAIAYHSVCETTPYGGFCWSEGTDGEIDPADIALDGAGNVTAIATSLPGCDIALAITGTGEDAYSEDYRKAPVDTELATVERYHDAYSQEGATGTGTACGWPVVASRTSDFGGRGQSSHTGLAVRIHDGL